jgi:hypothetical protein
MTAVEYRRERGRLREEHTMATEQVFRLLDEVQVLDVLRNHLPESQQYLVDRLQRTIDVRDAVELELEELSEDWEYFCDAGTESVISVSIPSLEDPRR